MIELDKDARMTIFKKASFCRHFENKLYDLIAEGMFKYPIYLSAGQEYISASFAWIIQESLKIKPLIFAQHRCHSHYLSFGGDPASLIDELFGLQSGCTGGMGGSASLHCAEIDMYGHDTFIGSQVPIAVGSCFASNRPTVVFMGDAAAEEDYVLGALGWAATKNLPILFIVEDNNLSILTEKKVRRSWEIHEVARSFGLTAYDLEDDPSVLYRHQDEFFVSPLLLNVRTNRMYWHAGAGRDSDNIFDRLGSEMELMGEETQKIHGSVKQQVDLLWEKQLEKL